MLGMSVRPGAPQPLRRCLQASARSLAQLRVHMPHLSAADRAPRCPKAACGRACQPQLPGPVPVTGAPAAGRLAVPVAHTCLRLQQQRIARKQQVATRAKADEPKETSSTGDSYSKIEAPVRDTIPDGVRPWLSSQKGGCPCLPGALPSSFSSTAVWACSLGRSTPGTRRVCPHRAR